MSVTPDTVSLSGSSGNSQAQETIARLLVEKLGEGSAFDIDVTYREELDPVASIPTPEECAEEISQIVAVRKINFEPEAIRGNLEAVLADLKKAKPAASKGVYMKKITLSTTMGPGVTIDQASIWPDFSAPMMAPTFCSGLKLTETPSAVATLDPM